MTESAQPRASSPAEKSRALTAAISATLAAPGFLCIGFRNAPCRLLLLLLAAAPATADPADLLVAVASNFAEVVQHVKPPFEAHTGHRAKLAIGSTGKLYAQITQGAPFDVLLAADAERPRRLVDEGYGVAESQMTYAFGRLTLWSARADFIGPDGEVTLRAGRFRALAIANPALAPYGSAAYDALRHLGLLPTLGGRLVMGQNIGQTYALIATGNAELGFVALAQVLSPRNRASGSRWDVPAHLYRPIRQDAVLLARAANNPAGRAFLEFLRSNEARSIIARYGYGFESPQ